VESFWKEEAVDYFKIERILPKKILNINMLKCQNSYDESTNIIKTENREYFELSVAPNKIENSLILHTCCLGSGRNVSLHHGGPNRFWAPPTLLFHEYPRLFQQG
jgi:hypothetical protein